MTSVKKYVPAMLTASVITVAAVAVPLQASAVTLPEISASELLAKMDTSITGFSGTVEKVSNLGLPALEMSSLMSQDMVDEMAETMPEGFEEFIPQVIEQNFLTEAIAFAAGTHQVRLFASEEGVRAQVLDPMSQRDIVVTEKEFWAYDAGDQTALTRTLATPVDREAFEGSAEELAVDVTDPRAVADFLMEQAGPDTTITVGDDHRVAGREAYRLVVEPNSSVSLVDAVHISVDFETGMPLGATVWSTVQEVFALSVAFTDITFETPDASLFAFSPPPGTTVETLEFPDAIEQTIADWEAGTLTEESAQARADELKSEFAGDATTTTTGEGWEMVASLSELPDVVPMEMLENELFQDLMTAVDGGTVFQTPLANVLVMDDGRVFAGAVTVAHLLTVASQ